MQKTVFLFILVLAILPLISFSCGVINTPGTYMIIFDQRGNLSNGACTYINASNVMFDLIVKTNQICEANGSSRVSVDVFKSDGEAPVYVPSVEISFEDNALEFSGAHFSFYIPHEVSYIHIFIPEDILLIIQFFL